MARTRPTKNQIAYHEKIEDHGDVGLDTTSLILDISKSTVHKARLVGDVFLEISEIPTEDEVPDGTFMTMTLIVEQDDVGNHEINYPDGLKWAYGVEQYVFPDSTSLSLLSFFSHDSGFTWNAYSSGNDYKLP